MEGDGGIIVLMEERVNSTYKWVMLIFATVPNNSDTYNVWCWSVCFILKEEYALTNTEIGLLVSVVNIGPLFCMLLSGGYLINTMKSC